jgi:hypothetical protein
MTSAPHTDEKKIQHLRAISNMREPPGRLGEIVRRMKQMSPPPPHIAALPDGMQPD